MKGDWDHLGRLKRLNMREDRGVQNISELQNLVNRRTVKMWSQLSTVSGS